MTEGKVTANGIALHYVRDGQGMPMMIIGWSGYGQMFSNRFRQHFDIVCHDCRHYVLSYTATPDELQALTLETFVDEAEAVRSALSLEKVALLGHSVHAQLALSYAVKYPQHVSRLVLVCGVPFSRAELAPLQEQYWQSHASERRKAIFTRDQQAYAEEYENASPDEQFTIFYLMNTAKYWADPEYPARSLLSQIRTGVALDQLFSQVPTREQVRARLESLPVPCLVVTGGQDYVCVATAWKELTVGLSGIVYRCIEESGHNPQTEHPEQFDSVLLDYFALK